MRVALIGGGMIAHDQILPSLYQLQREAKVSQIEVCARRAESLEKLASAPKLREAFPDRMFRARLDSYAQVLAELPAGQLAVIALPDPLHYNAVMTALRCGLNVLCVKPLVLTARESMEIETLARERGLMVAVEYHKRFDDRSHMARRRYRAGMFGEFRLGAACLLEKWYYRHSNFQEWFTPDATDAFTYIGCHYVDLVHFITGLLPAEVSVYGIREKFPNGNEGYLWTDARVVWNNGACLNVQNALGFPDAAPGSNTQGLTLYCTGAEDGGWIEHNDRYRGVSYCGPGKYEEPSPDYFQYVDLGGPGLKPAGYGFRSIAYAVERAIELENLGTDLDARRRLLSEWDARGIMATPANSRFNELTVEAARLSLAEGGKPASILYGSAEKDDLPRVFIAS
jgi:predicted dehydrogenase